MEQLAAASGRARPSARARGFLARGPALRQAVAEQWREREDFWLGVLFSLLVHVLILFGLALWKYIDEPAVPGFVFSSELGGEGSGPGAIDSLPVIDAGPVGGEAAGAVDAAPRLVDPAEFLEGSPGGGETPARAIAAALAGAGGGPGSGGGGGEGGGGHGGGVGFFGTRGHGRSFVFIVDCSGSMGGRRIERAREELIRAIGELKQYQKFFVFLYNNNTYPLFDLTSSSDLVVATREKKKQAIQWVQSRHAGGGTQPQQAFAQALAMKPDVIFFLTDGEIPEETRALVRDANRRETIIHTTGFQSRDGEEILKGIAHDNQGRYRHVD